MYKQCGAGGLREAGCPEFEDFAEYESAQMYYYWEVWHQPEPTADWIPKQQTPPQLLDRAAVNRLDRQLSEDWYRRLKYSQGMYYVYRHVWNGKSWVRESCNRGDISSGVVYRC
jgi:hypothetical protein